MSFIQSMLADWHWAFHHQQMGGCVDYNARTVHEVPHKSVPVDVVQDALRAGLSSFAEVMDSTLQELDKRVSTIEGLYGALIPPQPEVPLGPLPLTRAKVQPATALDPSWGLDGDGVKVVHPGHMDVDSLRADFDDACLLPQPEVQHANDGPGVVSPQRLSASRVLPCPTGLAQAQHTEQHTDVGPDDGVVFPQTGTTTGELPSSSGPAQAQHADGGLMHQQVGESELLQWDANPWHFLQPVDCARLSACSMNYFSIVDDCTPLTEVWEDQLM